MPDVSKQEEAKRERYPYARCIVDNVENTSFTATTDDLGDGRAVMVDLSAEHLRYLQGILRPGMQLNLLDSRSSKGDKEGIHYLQPSLIIIEPDFLIDISTIASCFKNYGQSPLNYIVKRLGPPVNTQPILLGNLASAVLDDAINAPETTTNDTIRHNFRDKAMTPFAITSATRRWASAPANHSLPVRLLTMRGDRRKISVLQSMCSRMIAWLRSILKRRCSSHLSFANNSE